MFNPGISNDSTGMVSGIYSSVIKGESVNDQGVFCTVNFKAGTNPGTSRIGISNLVIMDEQGNEIPSVISDSTINIEDRPLASTTDESENAVKGLIPSGFTKNSSVGWIVFILTATTFFALAYYLDRTE
ncbi:MAG: hypothetical protein R2741_00370 [Methanolobus sp.]